MADNELSNSCLPVPESIPDLLRRLPQWVCWKLIPAQSPSDKPRKLPINAKTGGPASSTDPTTWTTFDEALERVAADQLAGIGFVFTADDPFAGVDLDACRDAATGVLEPWAAEIVRQLASFAEVSPSGRGVHIFVQARLPERGRRKGRVEMYDRARFFTVTGNRLSDAPTTVEPRQSEIEALHFATFGTKRSKRKTATSKRVARSNQPITFDAIRNALPLGSRDRFDKLWLGDYSDHPSQSEADLALCALLVAVVGDDEETVDRWFRESKLFRPKWDEKHGARTYGEMTIAKATPDVDGEEGATEKLSVATQLLEMAAEQGVKTFRDQDRVAYAMVPVDSHHETYRVGDRAFQQWLRRLYHDNTSRAVTTSSVAEACALLEAKALFGGEERDVYIRVAAVGQTIYLDLCNDAWEVVEVTAAGWRIVCDAPVVFRRRAGMKALPYPVAGGSISELRTFVNCTDEAWPLLLSCLVAYLRPEGPFPVLCLLGEQGSAKSSTGRTVRQLIDPNSAPLRGKPSDERDLMIAAKNSWLLALDNMSHLEEWLSDALCRLATGGGFATRALYSNDDETLFDAQRPVLLTGIGDVVSRSDLLDRAVLCYAPRIASDRRRNERELRVEFEQARPRILGALLSAVAVGLARLPKTKLPDLPRMADFAIWATACEPGLGLRDGEFLAAYRRSQESSVEVALESSPIAQALQELLEKHENVIQCTATELLHKLNESMALHAPPRGWPRSAQQLSNLLRRAAPDLRMVGYEIEFTKAPKTRQRLIVVRRPGVKS